MSYLIQSNKLDFKTLNADLNLAGSKINQTL